MKKVLCALFGAIVLMSGCASSIKTTYTTYNENGKPLASGTTSIAGWSDKVFESAGEGMFVDMAKGTEGSGLKKASTRVEGSGFAETFKGIGDMMGGMAMLMAQMQGGGFINGGVTGGGGVSSGTVAGGAGGAPALQTPAQLALPAGDAVWILAGPGCGRCAVLKKNIGGVTDIGGVPIRWATEGESPYYEAVLRAARACAAGGVAVAYPYVVVVRDGAVVCGGRPSALTLEGLVGVVGN